MSFGSLAGFCSGYALKGIGRAGAFTVGCLFMGLTGLQVPCTSYTPLHAAALLHHPITTSPCIAPARPAHPAHPARPAPSLQRTGYIDVNWSKVEADVMGQLDYDGARE